MADQAGTYAGIAVGTVGLLAIGGVILYRKHQQDLRDLAANEQAIQERLQHVVDMNLPPFYVDHELDPVCIYEHELPPDAVPPVQPILVHSTSEEHIIPLEDDPLAPSTAVRPAFQREFSSFRFPSSSSSNNNIGRSADEHHSFPSLSSTIANGEITNEEASLAPAQQSHAVEVLTLPTAPDAATISSSPVLTSPIATSPRLINEEMLSLARLPAPPSYHVPNRVIDRSPVHHHHHSHSVSDISHWTDSSRHQDDYFGNVRIRSHTFSHPSPQHVPRHHQRDGQEDLPPTPRYSLEFPSHVPHQHHLEQYRRARELHVMRSSSSSSPVISQTGSEGRMQGPQAILMHERSYSQPYNMPWFTYSANFEDGLGQGQRRQGRPGVRARASTIGESSKLLMQRMQSLWRKTNGSTSNMPSPNVSGQNSLNASTIHVDDAQRDVPGVVGLGLDDQDRDTEQEVEDGAVAVDHVDANVLEVSERHISVLETSSEAASQDMSEAVQQTELTGPSLTMLSISIPLAVS
ncbi:hypothetical protein BGX28_001471 [Mortierella sp. GBA30]|nr:hypothetical protein BGX28_001471 [Mortierella sp. GBA30]